MLVLKKISVKKLTIYTLIIVLMIGGTGFRLYQNKKLTSRKPIVVDDPTRYDKFMTAGAALPGSDGALNQSSFDPLKTEAMSQPAFGSSKIKNNQALDLTIFSLEKFKALADNVVISQADSGLGKRDLFKPN